MLKRNLTYLLVGAAFGCLVGWMVYRATGFAPETVVADVAPGPTAPSGGSSEFDAVMGQLEELRARLESDPDDLASLVRIGDLLFRLQIWDQALRFYDRAIDVQASAELLTVSGLCLRQLQRPDEALERFQSAREMDPGHWQALYNIVVVRLDLEDIAGAREALAELERQRPGDGDVAALREAVDRHGDGTPGS